MRKLTRRYFLELTGSTAAGALLTAAGCTQPAAQPSHSTSTAASTAPPEALPTAVPATPATPPTTAPTETAVIEGNPETNKTYRRPEVIQHFPTVGKSQVVRARSANAWDGDKVSPQVVRKMVDQSISQLTGITDAKDAWRALFDPSERIAIKVNAFRNSTIFTHTELVYAVTDSLQEAGIPGEQITIFDFYTDELETAGFTINKDGPGVRCYGTDKSYATSLDIAERSFEISDILVQADALINMPVLKSHMIAGVTFALKNHYGSVSYPDGLHNIAKMLPGLSTLKPIKDATRLVIGDVLHVNTKYSSSWPYWEADTRSDAILMSYDPLAHDRVGMDMLIELAEANGNNTRSLVGMADPWFKTCAEAQFGAASMEQIELKDIQVA